MADFVIKANDREPPIEATLSLSGQPVPQLSNSTVQFIMRRVDALAPAVKSAAVVVNDTLGIVRYYWKPGDTAVPGEYICEWEVTYPSGNPQTFPRDTYNTVTIRADLDQEA